MESLLIVAGGIALLIVAVMLILIGIGLFYANSDAAGVLAIIFFVIGIFAAYFGARLILGGIY